MNRCRVCDRSLPRDHRTYCSQACRLQDRSARTRNDTDGRLEEVTHLLEAGESPDQIAAQLERTLYAIAAWLSRHGHKDLACQFERAAWRERRSA